MYPTRTGLWTVVVDTLTRAGWGQQFPEVPGLPGRIDLDEAIRVVDDVYEWLLRAEQDGRPHGLLGEAVEESLRQMIDARLLPANGVWGQGQSPASIVRSRLPEVVAQLPEAGAGTLDMER